MKVTGGSGAPGLGINMAFSSAGILGDQTRRSIHTTSGVHPAGASAGLISRYMAIEKTVPRVIDGSDWCAIFFFSLSFFIFFYFISFIGIGLKAALKATLRQAHRYTTWSIESIGYLASQSVKQAGNQQFNTFKWNQIDSVLNFKIKKKSRLLCIYL